MKTRTIVFLAFIASAISFAKFSPCIGFNWATPGQYIHACYSDLPSLLGNRSIGSGAWAFSGEQPVEYPVITGLVMYLTDKYEGGILTLTQFEKEIRTKAGDILVFNSDTYHEISTHLGGERITARIFLYNK
mgnify:CR=1 FL=1